MARQSNRLSYTKFFALCEWVKAQEKAFTNYTKAAEVASTELTFSVTAVQVKQAEEATGKKLVQVDKIAKKDRIQVLAMHISDLMTELGKEVPASLKAIIDRKGQP